MVLNLGGNGGMVKSVGCGIWRETGLVRVWLKFCDFEQITNLL